MRGSKAKALRRAARAATTEPDAKKLVRRRKIGTQPDPETGKTVPIYADNIFWPKGSVRATYQEMKRG